MNSNLGHLYDRFTTRPKEMTAWEIEDWIDKRLKRSGRGYYIPKGEIFCRALDQDGSLCKYTRRVSHGQSILTHCRRHHVIEYNALAPREPGMKKEEKERAMECFGEQVLQVLRANNINEFGTWDELTAMIKNYELREKQLESKKTTQLQQSGNFSGAIEQHDSALLSMKQPRADVSSTIISGENTRGVKSIAAMGKTTGMQSEKQMMVSRKRAASNGDREGDGKLARTVERTTLSAAGTIENPQ
ncbi:hypothetical protein BGAL_0294g00100 [Botrytis galanthina]|uniref:Uncharacterized protein n=1 Tax=Botrytis galanthina TaxID=278940 RepID=A0A4S8QRA6_9HELO|nr:hypothetical protein BGAL_0294g00100 [Botrytis galanthina]